MKKYIVILILTLAYNISLSKDKIKIETGWSKFKFFTIYTEALPKGTVDSVYYVYNKYPRKSIRVLFINDTTSKIEYGYFKNEK